MSFAMLKDFIRAEMPPLFDQLAALPRGQAPRVLNAATGLDIKPGDPMDSTARQYLDALLREKERGTLLLGALARGMREACKQRRENS